MSRGRAANVIYGSIHKIEGCVPERPAVLLFGDRFER